MNVITGGHYSSGSRVIQMLLEQTHNIICDNEAKDYEEGFSEKDNTLAERVLRGENPEFPVNEGRPLTEPWSLKNPDFMMIFPYLKKTFPKAKRILVVRHGVDQVLCENRCMAARFVNVKNNHKDFLGRQMKFWNEIYKKAYRHADMIVRLEDLVYDTKNTVRKLVALLDIPYPDTSMIEKPKSMGRRFEKCSVFDYKTSEKYNYTPKMKNKLYKLGKEMLTEFNYD